MPSFELSKLQAVSAPRALSEANRTPIDPRTSASSPSTGPTATAGVGVSLEVNAGVDTAKAPVDQDRVAEIKAALRDGSYPLVPTQIADAMIAAQHSYEAQR